VLGPANRAVVVSPDSSEARSTWTFVVSIHTVFVVDEEEDAAPARAVARRGASRDAQLRGTRRFPRSRPRAVVRPGEARGAPRALADVIAVEENARAETLSSVSRDEESLRGMPTKTRRRLAVTRRISPELRFEGCQLFV
jgi:hypothetical protein